MKLLPSGSSFFSMPSLHEIAMLRAARLAAEGATFKVNDADFTRCITNGWITRAGELTRAGLRLLAEETSGAD